jgi:hypothetical protein
MVMIFLGFSCVCKEVNMFLYFRNNLVLNLKCMQKCWKGVSYDLNWTGVHGFTCLLSRWIVVPLSAMQMTETWIWFLLYYLIIFIGASRLNLKTMQHILLINENNRGRRYTTLANQWILSSIQSLLPTYLTSTHHTPHALAYMLDQNK